MRRLADERVYEYFPDYYEMYHLDRRMKWVTLHSIIEKKQNIS